jgi:hypothetical protein
MGDHGVRTTARRERRGQTTMFATRAFLESVSDGGRRRLRSAQLGSRWMAGFDAVSRRVGNKDVVAQAVSMARRRGTGGELRLATDEGPGLVEGMGQGAIA